MPRERQNHGRATYFRALTAPFEGAQTLRSVIQLTGTAASFFILWYAMLRSLEVSYVLTLVLAVPAAGFLLRLFMIQHDCGHGSFFRSQRVTDIVGHWIGVLTLLPYRYFRRVHAIHHAHVGDFEHVGTGDFKVLMVEEYLGLSPAKRALYRATRNPFLIFGIGAFYHVVIKQRFPWQVPRTWRDVWRSIWLTNLCILGLVTVLVLAIGWRRFLMVQLPITTLTASIGIWISYVQHQFENGYWARRPEWDYFDAALQGSSHLVLPRPLQWMTASVGLHHVHHVSQRIPNYRLQACLRAHPEFQQATKIRPRDTWALARLALWDEGIERMVSFAEAHDAHRFARSV